MFIQKYLATFLFLISSSVLAQVSSVEGIEPMEGVAIPKAPIIQPNAFKPGTIFKDCGECPEMVVIPAGSFLMGSPPDAAQDPFSNSKPVKIGEAEEKPQHQVEIHSFAIGKYEVTQEQWYAIMGNNPSLNKGRSRPVENVSWVDSQLFVQKLAQKTGKKYRLPTEAEWEYAARAGSTTLYPWGDSDSLMHVYAWFNAIANTTNPVGLKKPNQFGLYDMIGNVWEWTLDCWNSNYIGAPIDGSASMAGNCSKRVLRGGSWTSTLYSLDSAKRIPHLSTSKSDFFGFRIALDVTLENTDMVAVQSNEETVPKQYISKPSDSYLGRLRARVKPNITFSDKQLLTVHGNPSAEVDVVVNPNGQIIGMKLTQSSGNADWDQAVLKALEKTGTLPRDENGKIPSKIPFVFRPRD